jgi:hypothetical protein
LEAKGLKTTASQGASIISTKQSNVKSRRERLSLANGSPLERKAGEGRRLEDGCEARYDVEARKR